MAWALAWDSLSKRATGFSTNRTTCMLVTRASGGLPGCLHLRSDSVILLLTLLALVAPQGERRVILAVGDSMTAGYGLPAEQSYPAQLERELLRLGFNYRVVNHGVTGSTSAQALGGFTRG